MRNETIGLDVAEDRQLFVGDSDVPETKWKAVWNIDKEKVAAIVSKDYKIVQHRDVVESFIDACDGLNIKHSVNVRNHGNRIFVDVTFPDSKLYVKEKGEEFIAGFRLINSYDKTTGVHIIPRLMRLACLNGMIVDIKGFVKVFSYRHNQEMAQNFAGYMEKALAETVESHPKLQAMVNDCIGDSVEWATAEKVLQFLVGKRKHFEQVEKNIDRTKPITRWDIYNAITRYATHGEQLKPNIEMWLQKKAQELLVTPSKELLQLAEAKLTVA